MVGSPIRALSRITPGTVAVSRTVGVFVALNVHEDRIRSHMRKRAGCRGLSTTPQRKGDEITPPLLGSPLEEARSACTWP